MWLTILKKMPNISDYQQHQLLWGFFRKQQEDALERPFCFRDTGDQLFVKPVIRRNIPHNHPQHVVPVARHSVALHHLLEPGDGRGKLRQPGAVVALGLELDEHRQPQP